MLMLDTDVLVDVLRGRPSAVAWLEAVASDEISVSGFVAMELLQGCRSREDVRSVERRLRSLSIVWPAAATCDGAMALFGQAHLSHGLGILDAVIGQQAADANAVFCTFNTKHYAAVPGLPMRTPYDR